MAAGAGVAALGAVFLGEFAFDGLTVVASAAVLGFAVAEAVTTTARVPSTTQAVVAAALCAVALLYAGWTFSGQDLGSLSAEAWLAVALGPAIAWVRGRPRRSAPGSRPAPPPPASPDDLPEE